MTTETNTEPAHGAEPTLADHIAALRLYGTRDAKTIDQVAERAIDALCCGAKAADLPFANDHAFHLRLIDLLFEKLSSAREADALDARGDEPETTPTTKET